MASKKSRLDKKTLLVLGGVLGVETVACVGIGMGIHTRKVALEKTLQGKESALANVRTVSASLPALQAQYEKMQAQVKFLEASLPPAEYIPTLLGQVEQTAKACGVTIQEFRPKATPGQSTGSGPNNSSQEGSADGTTKMQFDISIKGNYRQFQRFLQSLTRFRKILALDSVSLNPSAQENPGVSPVLTGQMSFTAYIMPPGPDQVPAPVADRPSVASTGAGPVVVTTASNRAVAVVAPAVSRAAHSAGQAGQAAQNTAANAVQQAAAERGLAPRTSPDQPVTPRG